MLSGQQQAAEQNERNADLPHIAEKQNQGFQHAEYWPNRLPMNPCRLLEHIVVLPHLQDSEEGRGPGVVLQRHAKVMFLSCIKYVLCMYFTCIILVLSLFLACTMLVLNMFCACSWLVPSLFHMCTMLVFNMFLACSHLVPGLFLACSICVLCLYSTCS
jgi:hypothetical protein